MADNVKNNRTAPETKNAATLFLEDRIKLSDALLFNYQKLSGDLNNRIQSMCVSVAAGKTAEELKDVVLEYNEVARDYSFMTQEFHKVMACISDCYKMLKSMGVEIQLGESDLKRLEFLEKQQVDMFYLDGNVLKDVETKEVQELKKTMVERVDVPKFIEGLKTYPIYKQVNKLEGE